MLRRFDLFMYWLARPSIERLFRANAGLAYLFKLHMDAWVEENPPSDSQKRTAELLVSVESRMDEPIVD